MIKFIECQLLPSKQEAFSTAQRCWSEVSACPGFISQYVSLWRDEQSHSNYMQDQFNMARAQVKFEEYIDEIVGYLLPTISSWQIDPAAQ